MSRSVVFAPVTVGTTIGPHMDAAAFTGGGMSTPPSFANWTSRSNASPDSSSARSSSRSASVSETPSSPAAAARCRREATF